MINEEEVIKDLVKIISQREYVLTVEDSDNFHFEYDWLCAREPLNWQITKFKTFFELPYQWAEDIEQAIAEAKQRVYELEERGDIFKPAWDIMWRKVVVTWYERIPFDQYLAKKVSNMRSLKKQSADNNPTLYLAKVLWINPSQIRYVYIKHLLRGKISIWDLKELCEAKNSDIDLYSLISQWAKNEM